MRFVVLALLLGLTACSEPDFYRIESRPGNGGTTAVAIWISDSPVDRAAAVVVRIDAVELGGVRIAVGRDVELLALRNGRRALLAELAVPPGTYDRLRLVLAAAGHRVRADGGEHDLAATATVVDVAGPFRVAGDRFEIHADFNVRLSVVEAGGRWTLRPVVRGHDAREVAQIEGEALPGAVVSAQRGGREFGSTRAAADGSFLLGPLPAGTFDVVVTAPGRQVLVARDVRAPSEGHRFIPATAGAGGLRGWTDPGPFVVRLLRDGHLVALAGVDGATGAFFFASVPAGTYDVEVWDAGGLRETRGAVLVEPGRVVDAP